MKKFNVYPELKYIFISIPFFILFPTFLVFAFIIDTLLVFFLMGGILFLIIGVFLLVFGIPNTLNYYRCNSSVDFGKATVIDKFEKISSNEKKNNKWIIVLEYRINGICYRSANIVTSDIAKDLEIKSIVDVKVAKNMALYVKFD